MRANPSPARIAIVGGGVGGVSLAKFLRDVDDARATFHVSIFDTGERACGGRSSSKALEGVDVDHGLQYFTLASDVARESFARPLVECGALAEWSAGAVGALREGEFRAFDDDVARYVGVGGFRAMSEALESNADEVRRPQWVGAMSPSRFDDDGRATAWTLATNASDRAKRLGEYDFVVIAHNGKCAHRLASTAKGLDGRGACDKVTNALRCGFGVKPRADMERENKLLLSSVWSVMVAFDGALEFGFEGAHVVDGEPLSWVSNISAKRGSDFADGRTRVVLQSTAEYARDNKVPQEAVPKEKSAEVVDTLVAALERALARPAGSLRGKVTSYKTQLWGAANPLNCANVSCVLDLDSSVAAIGDWCTDGPACVEAAVLSAYALARALDERYGDGPLSESTIELNDARARWSLPKGANSAQGGFPGTTGVPAMREASRAPAKGRSGGRGRGRGRGGRRSGGRGRGGGRRGGGRAPSTASATARAT